MAETRKRLTDLQIKHLGETEKSYNDKQAEANLARIHLNVIIELIFDAHGVVGGPNVSYDPRTSEIVIV